MESSIFIQVLEYGENVGLEGTSVKTFKEWAHEKGLMDIESEEPQNRLLIESITNLFFECFQLAEIKYTEKAGEISKQSYVLKTECYFRLIDYRELQGSRVAAKSATKNAFIAIGISVLAIILSAALTFVRLNTPVRLNNSDLAALINANAPANVPSEVKLDSLQMAQILSAIGDDSVKPEIEKKELPNRVQGGEASLHELINQYFEGEDQY